MATRWRWAILGAIFVLATVLRVVEYGQSPPGLNQDEAVHLWNARCLLATGKDLSGQPWPIFYTRCLGSNYPTLQTYVLMPFQVFDSLTLSTRLPALLAGLATILLIYYVGRRLAGDAAGLAAALLLALNPWALFLGRWGHEACLTPLLTIAPLAALFWARLPTPAADSRPPSLVRSALAGLLAGVACYGYLCIRLFLPLFLLAVIAACWRGWRACLRSQAGRRAAAAFFLGGLVTFGPLAWKQLTDPEASRRAEWVWRQRDKATGYEISRSLDEKVAAVAGRYLQHFAPDFLFVRGDRYESHNPPFGRQFHWYALPLMLLGLAWSVRNFKRSAAARVVLLWAALYPIGDSLNRFEVGGQPSLHALRSSPGACAMVMLSAAGAAWGGAWLWRKRKAALAAAAAVLAAWMAVENVRYLRTYYGEYNRQADTYHLWHVDLLEACGWLRPQMDRVRAVFVTLRGPDPRNPGNLGFNQPFSVMMPALRYDPHDWFAQPREVETGGQWDLYLRVGQFRFMYNVPDRRPGRNVRQPPWLNDLEEMKRTGSGPGTTAPGTASASPDRVLLLLRPWEAEQLGYSSPIHRFVGPDGRDALWACEGMP